MNPIPLKDLKSDLKNASQEELMELILRLIRFKKENKELVSYLLYHCENDDLFIVYCKEEMENGFELINKSSAFFIRKSIRKILSATKKNIRYSQKKIVEIELLLHFCKLLIQFHPKVKENKVLMNTFESQMRMVRNAIGTLDNDLQHDYSTVLEEIVKLR